MHNASWLTTDRHGGVSQEAFASNNLSDRVGDDAAAVTANREQVRQQLGAEHVVFIKASHSGRVVDVREPGQDVEGADALITEMDGVALAALSADCVPVGLAGADGWIAVIHCGWRGLVERIVPNTLRQLADAGCEIETLRAHLGPCVCPDCYPVDRERAAAVAAVVPSAVVNEGSDWAIDVRAGVLAQLKEAGVQASWDPRCTAEDPDLYSYRRDGITGRQALCVGPQS